MENLLQPQLKTAGLERSSIVKVTGHRKEKSLDDYDEGDENEQRLLSHTICNGTNINSQLTQTHSSTSVHSSTNSSSNTFNPSSLDARGNNFNQAGFAVQMPSYISGRMISVSLSWTWTISTSVKSLSTSEAQQPLKNHSQLHRVARTVFRLNRSVSFPKNFNCWTCWSQLESTANIIKGTGFNVFSVLFFWGS